MGQAYTLDNEDVNVEREIEMTEKVRYSGAYNRLFPVKVSTSTFITLYILFLLKREESGLYGKEIIDKIEKRFRGSWKPSHGLVYPILRELEAEGLIKGEWQGGGVKKTICVYKITEEGIETYEKEQKRHESAFTESLLMMETLMEDLYDTEVYDFSKV